jgi:hypothetical protein
LRSPPPFGEHFCEGIEVRRVQPQVGCSAAAASAAPLGMDDRVERFGPELKTAMIGDGERFK